MVDVLVAASEQMNGMYLNGVQTRRPPEPLRTNLVLQRLDIGRGAAKNALREVYEALQFGEDQEPGYGSLVRRISRGGELMREGPVSLDGIAQLSLSAEDGDYRLKPNEPVEFRQPVEDLRVSDRARIVAAAWHNLQMARWTW